MHKRKNGRARAWARARARAAGGIEKEAPRRGHVTFIASARLRISHHAMAKMCEATNPPAVRMQI